MATATQEIHCPKCGVLIRKVDLRLMKARRCPNCNNPQAIYLDYSAYIQRSIVEHNRKAYEDMNA